MLNQSKILYLVKTMDIGGAERFTLNLAGYFINKTAGITVASTGGIFVSQLEQIGIKHIKLKNQPKILNFYSLLKELSIIINEGDYSIVHCQHRIFSFLLQFISKKKFVHLYTAHNVFTDLFQKCIFPDYAVAVSVSILENLKSYSFINKNKISQINLGVRIPEIYKTPVGSITLGFIGRLINEKGIFSLLESVKILSSDNLDFKLLIKGKGDLETITSYIKHNNLSRFVFISPPSSDVDEIYYDINILILPTRLNEGLPFSILEAAARKILVISSDAGGIMDFLKDGQTGVMLDSVDPVSVARKIKDVISNYDNYLPVIDNALKKIKDEYSLELMNTKYEGLYNKLLGSKSF
jgi:glycosyltransferase involved in cell wall biosynthesis